MSTVSFRFAEEKDTAKILFFIKELARVAVERDCGRLEWCCLDWNKPSVDFYLSLGAQPLNDRTVFRTAGETLKKFAEK